MFRKKKKNIEPLNIQFINGFLGPASAGSHLYPSTAGRLNNSSTPVVPHAEARQKNASVVAALGPASVGSHCYPRPRNLDKFPTPVDGVVRGDMGHRVKDMGRESPYNKRGGRRNGQEGDGMNGGVLDNRWELNRVCDGSMRGSARSAGQVGNRREGSPRGQAQLDVNHGMRMEGRQEWNEVRAG